MAKRPPRPKGKRGRTSKFTPKVGETICKMIREGNTYRVACLCAGISTATLRDWKKKGRASRSGAYRDFLQDVEEAEAEAIRAKVKTVKLAAEGFEPTTF